VVCVDLRCLGRPIVKQLFFGVMASHMVQKVCFDIAHLRTSHVCRAFHVTSKQQYARTVKPRVLFPHNVHGINAANVPPQAPQRSNKFDDFHGIIEPLNDSSQFE